MSGAEGGPGKRAGHKASTAPRSDPYSTGESSQRFAEAGGSPIQGTTVTAGSSPDNGGTCRHDQTMRVRLARSEGVTQVNQWWKSRKARTGSNLVDKGRSVARDHAFPTGWVVNSGAWL
jgi:hypothetical protein